MRITKVYTKTGDAGKTRLAGGREVWKDDARVEAYGAVDELNAAVGLVRVFNADPRGGKDQAERLERELRWIQNKLFDLGGILATEPGESFPNMPRISEDDVARLERLMDECQTELTPLKEFILPGGGKVSGLLHQARTVCRRAERGCIPLLRDGSIEAVLVKFLNRLGDALFVLGRWASKTQGEAEYLWERTTKKQV